MQSSITTSLQSFAKTIKTFFCAVNYFIKSTDNFSFQKKFDLERDQILRFVSDASAFCAISESGSRETVTVYGLRWTVVSKIFECGHALSAVDLRTGNLFLKSFESYKNLHGSLGLRQQLDLFSSTAELLRSVKRARVDKDDTNGLNETFVGEKGTSFKNSAKSDTSLPELQAQA